MKGLKNYGYKKSLNKVGDTFGYRNKDKYQIVFYDTKEILKFDENYEVEGITMQELQAINEKCRELGWLV
jgi:hypothetical protein